MSYSIVKDNGTIEVRTNNQSRNMIYGYELTKKEKKNFDYIPDDEIYSMDFIRYKGWVYDVSEFVSISSHSPFYPYWHGYKSDSFFSGVLLRIDPDDNDKVIMGTYYA